MDRCRANDGRRGFQREKEMKRQKRRQNDAGYWIQRTGRSLTDLHSAPPLSLPLSEIHMTEIFTFYNPSEDMLTK